MVVQFFTRDPILTNRSGSTTYILNMLSVLRSQGASVNMNVTLGHVANRRPILFAAHPLSVVDHYEIGGYLRLGRMFIQVNALKPWILTAFRAVERISQRLGVSRVSDALIASLYRAFPSLEWKHQSWNVEPATLDECRYVESRISDSTALVMVNYHFMAPLLALSACQGRRKILLMHDLHSRFQRDTREAGLEVTMAEISEDVEMARMRLADVVLAIQSQEADKVRAECPGVEVIVLPHSVPLAKTMVPQVKGRCLFVGSNTMPNVVSMQRFLAVAWPLIRERQPGAVLHVCGSVCAQLKQIGQGVVLRGVVENLADEYGEAEVCIVPLVVGSGLKIKLIEALSYGRASVSTPVGVQGVESLVADCVSVESIPSHFANAVAELLADTNLRRRREEASLTLVERHFSEQICSSRLLAAVSTSANADREMIQRTAASSLAGRV